MTGIETGALVVYLAVVGILVFSMAAKWSYDRKHSGNGCDGSTL